MTVCPITGQQFCSPDFQPPQWAKSPKKKSVGRVYLWHCILSVELTETHSFRLFFGDFAHWVIPKWKILNFSKRKLMLKRNTVIGKN